MQDEVFQIRTILLSPPQPYPTLLNPQVHENISRKMNSQKNIQTNKQQIKQTKTNKQSKTKASKQANNQATNENNN